MHTLGFLHLLSALKNKVEFITSQHLDRFHPVPLYEGTRLPFSVSQLAIFAINDQGTEIHWIYGAELHSCMPIVLGDRTKIYVFCALLNEVLHY